VGRLTWPEGATCASREITRIRVMIISACLIHTIGTCIHDNDNIHKTYMPFLHYTYIPSHARALPLSKHEATIPPGHHLLALCAICTHTGDVRHEHSTLALDIRSQVPAVA
jgi:hypothetical protein